LAHDKQNKGANEMTEAQLEILADAEMLLRYYERNRNLWDQSAVAGQYRTAADALRALIDELTN
jgi:hypothetical protein